MKTICKSLLSLVLVFAIVLQLMPASVFAAKGENGISDGETVSSGETVIDSGESVCTEIQFEDVSLREESVKHFRKADGTYLAVQYDAPVHYLDDEGSWQDYDNTLRPLATARSGEASEYRVENGDSLRIFAAQADAEQLLTFQKGDYSLTLSPAETANDAVVSQEHSTAEDISEAPVAATVLETASAGELVDDPLLAQTQPDKFYSALEYENVLNGATLRYENYGRTVKESILIAAPQEEYRYAFQIEAKGLTAELQEDGIVTFSAEDGEVVYYIPAPYMLDANRALSFDAAYTLEGGDGSYTLTVTADAEWLNQSDRAFPVTLDPTITEGNLPDARVTATYIRSYYHGSPPENANALFVGDNGKNDRMTHTLARVNQLIALPDGSEVTEAKFYLSQYAYEKQSGGQSSLKIGLYPMCSINGLTSCDYAVSRWQNLMNVVAWDNVYGSNAYYVFNESTPIIDAVTVGQVQSTTPVGWDITLLARQWYDGPNTNLGFILRPVLPQAEVTSRASFYGPDNGIAAKPQLEVTYRNTVGIEAQYSYRTAGVGRAGTAYISDATLQQTTVVPLLSSASDVMPFALSMIYNSVYGNREFKEDATMLHTKPNPNMNLGVGWKLSAQESVCFANINGTQELIYTDADGTEHYFQKTGTNTYQDEDGLGLKLTVSGSDFTMTDDYGNGKFFGNGYLKRQYDAYGNTLYFNYNGSAQLATITRQNVGSDTTETLATLTYDATTKRLLSVREEAGRTVSFTYTSLGSTYSISTIKFADNAEMRYGYNANDGVYRMTDVYDSEAQYGMEFSYTAKGRVSTFAEYAGTGKSYGAKFSAEKLAQNQTRYCYYGKDGTQGTSDDIYTHKVLDILGRTINSYSTDATQKHVLGVGVSNYTTNNGTSKQNNRLTAGVSAGQQGVNLLNNASVENADAMSSGISRWTQSAQSGQSVSQAEAYLGELSLCLSQTTANATPNYWQQAFTPDETHEYTFSGYIKVPASTGFTGSGGVSLQFVNNSGVIEESERVNYSTENIGSGWIRLSVTATLTAGSTVQARFSADNFTGKIYGDAFQLEKESSAATFNIIEDGSFEHQDSIDSSSSSHYWYKTGSAEITGNEATYFGTKTLQLSSTDGFQRISRNVPVNAPLGSTFILSAWAKAEALPGSEATQETELNRLKPYFGLILRFYYTDGTEEVHYYPCDQYYRDWQYVQGVAVPQKTGSNVKIRSITIVAAYEKNINKAYFDNISFRMEPVQTYAYDSNGNVKTATQMGSGMESASYSGVDLTQYTAANQNKYTYTYNNQHDVLTTSVGGVTVSNTYSGAGNVLSSVLSNQANTLQIRTSTTVTTDKNHPAIVTDANGSKTTYTYDASTELLTKVQNARGIITDYTYDAVGRTKKVAQSGADIQYFYENGQLKTLGRTTQNATGSNIYQGYTFETNAWGQTTAIHIATSTNGTSWTDRMELASYTYDGFGTANNGGGNLAQMAYGNGDAVSYTYDNLDRLVRKDYTSGRYVLYDYNAEGQLAKLTYGNDGMEDMVFDFEYDSLGRLIRSSQTDVDNFYQRTEHLYDAYNRLSSQSWVLSGRSYTESFTYSDGESGDGSLKTMTTGTGATLHFGYDSLKRLNEVKAKSGSNTLFTTAYAYRNISTTQTTPQVEYRNVKLRDSSTILEGKKYEYDSLGNIVKIRQSTSPFHLLVAYEYDNQNQLTSEVYYDGSGEATANITVAYYYDYDTAGNLLKVQKGTVNSAGTLAKTTEQTYTYGNTNWRDLLTAVNGNTITYDASGNPLHYGEWNFDWQDGRQLISAEIDTDTTNTSLTYTYDANGIRTSKTYTEAVYETLYHTVTFVANGTTLKTMTVEDGYVLQDSDYPELPEVVGAAGIWVKRTSPIHSDITLNAKYVAKIPHYVTFTADGKTVKVLEVSDGYVLKDSDYPTVPAKNGYTGHWNKYTSAIRSDITIKATYKKDTGLPIQPTRPTGAVMSEELPEPIEPQDVEQPEDDTDATSADNTVEPLADHSGQGVVSSQTVTHEYLTRAGKVARETVTRDSSTEILDFIYDESGRPFALNYSTNGSSFTTYYYILNLQGDVVKLVTSSGSAVATYEYDAWGNILSKSGTMADKNPLLYRGYYYDAETGFYYLQSRYYDPANRRFINADSYASTGQGFIGTNMFAYCNNNPVMYADDDGSAPWWLLPFWGYIHMKVERHILKENGDILGLEAEQTIRYYGSKKYSRADLCNILTGEVWEIKSCGPASLGAEAQLAKYCTGYVAKTNVEVQRGKILFEGEFTDGDFKIKYWSESPGIVLYTFALRDSEEAAALACAPARQKSRESARQGMILPFFGIPKFGSAGGKTDDTVIAAYMQ